MARLSYRSPAGQTRALDPGLRSTLFKTYRPEVGLALIDLDAQG